MKLLRITTIASSLGLLKGQLRYLNENGMACGRPFIASDVPGLHDVVKGAGILFPHGDEHALAETISTIASTPKLYYDLASSGQERAKQYDIVFTANEYMALYNTLVF